MRITPPRSDVRIGLESYRYRVGKADKAIQAAVLQREEALIDLLDILTTTVGPGLITLAQFMEGSRITNLLRLAKVIANGQGLSHPLSGHVKGGLRLVLESDGLEVKISVRFPANAAAVVRLGAETRASIFSEALGTDVPAIAC